MNLMRVGLCVSVLAMTACSALPSAGPGGRNVGALANQQASVNLPKVALVEVNEPVALELYRHANAQASLASLGQAYAHAGTVGAGDVLDITIWEAAPAVLFGGSLSSAGAGSAQTVSLPNQMVNADGTISVPFAGNVAVQGKTPQQIQDLIRSRLSKMANQPQVLVKTSQNHAANVSVIRAGNSVRLPLTAAGERVLDAVAAVGGSTSNVQDTNVQLTRGDVVKTVALEDLVANPRQNVLLRKGDVVTLITNPYTFTAMGAVGRTQEVGFSVRGLSLAEAVGRMGGLQDRQADARGVFVFRYSPVSELPSAEQATWLNQGYLPSAEVPTVYRLNLADANSLFWMQRFPVKNKDVVYVSNAPLAEVQKFLQFVLTPITSSIYNVDRAINF